MCCSLVALFVVAGFVSLIVGLILINQKNTATTIATTMATITTAMRRVFTSSQVVDSATIICLSVNNTNPAYTQCNDLQQNYVYGSGLSLCSTGWSTSLSPVFSAIAFCQLFLNSSGASFQAYYDCDFVSLARFTWAGNGAWSSSISPSYTKNLRCYY